MAQLNIIAVIGRTTFPILMCRLAPVLWAPVVPGLPIMPIVLANGHCNSYITRFLPCFCFRDVQCFDEEKAQN